jgi:Fanconi anemia group M protein
MRERMTIKIDSREDISSIGNILSEQYHLNVTRTHLQTGDIIIDDRIAVERKTGKDFVQSLMDGRLFRQAWQMKKAYQNCLFLIEEKNLLIPSGNCHPNTVQGALVSLSVSWQIPILFSENAAGSASLIWLITKQSVPLTRLISMRPGRRPKPVYKKQLYFLQGLPGIGITLANRLLNHFKSIDQIMRASVSNLTEVTGLGKRKAEGIRVFLESTIG